MFIEEKLNSPSPLVMMNSVDGRNLKVGTGAPKDAHKQGSMYSSLGNKRFFSKTEYLGKYL